MINKEYTSGQVFLGRWVLSQDLSVDYIIHYDETMSPTIEDVWVNWKHVLEMIVPDEIHQPKFEVIWTYKSISYCPILDFLYHTALLSTNRCNSIFSQAIESLILGKRLIDDKKTSLLRYEPEDSQMWRQGEKRKLDSSNRSDDTEVLNKRVKFDDIEMIQEGFTDDHTDDLSDMIGDFLEKKDRHKTLELDNSYISLKKDKLYQVCTICSKRFSGKVRLYSHYIVHHPDSTALHPPKPSHTLIPCKLCGELYMRRSHLYKHYVMSHPDKPQSHPAKLSSLTSKENMHQCQGCEKSFVAEVWLYKHCLQEHPDDETIRPPKPLRVGRGVRLANMHERGNKLVCGLPGCEHKFSHFKGLVRHERTHTEACICILCGLPCWTSTALIDHCDQKHASKSQYICRICGFYNYSEINLKLHTVQIHMKGTKEYECQHCPYKSTNISTFSAHVRNHSTTASFVCEECGKECPTPQSLSTHRRSHMPTSSFAYSCSYCSKRFPHVSLLLIHERVHTGEKPFQCNDCGQCFGSQSSLIKHNRNIHTPEDQMPYKCNECGKTFSKARRKVYFGHLKQHSGIKDHICPLCNAAFSSRGYLGNHFKKVHKRKLYEVEKEMKLKKEAVLDSKGDKRAGYEQGQILKVETSPSVGIAVSSMHNSHVTIQPRYTWAVENSDSEASKGVSSISIITQLSGT